MPEKAFSLSGWKAAVALVLVGALAVARWAGQAQTLDSEGRAVLTSWLASEYTRGALAASPADPADPATARRLLEATQVEILSLAARGRGDDVVVRAEVRVAGATPRDGKPIRYYRMKHSLTSGWQLVGETSAMSYHLRLW